MTLEEILDCDDPAILEKLTDEELLKYWQKYLTVTRPELAPKPQRKQQDLPMPVLSPQKQKALEALAEAGVDLSFMNRRRKK